jgi:hypothetical protein
LQQQWHSDNASTTKFRWIFVWLLPFWSQFQLARVQNEAPILSYANSTPVPQNDRDASQQKMRVFGLVWYDEV